MARTATRSRMRPDEYLAWERAQPSKHEYFHGEVFAMAGGSPRHNALGARLGQLLGNLLGDRGCVVLSSDQRVALAEDQRYVYPDLSVASGPLAIISGDVLANPSIVVEVLSSATEQYDRGAKWEGYQALASLTDYLLVSQTEPRIEHFRRSADGAWVYRAATTGGHVTLGPSNGPAIELEVDRVFAGLMALPGE